MRSALIIAAAALYLSGCASKPVEAEGDQVRHERLIAVENAMKHVPRHLHTETRAKNPEFVAMRTEIRHLEARLEAMRAKFTSTYPGIAQAEADLVSKRDQLNAIPEFHVATVRQRLNPEWIQLSKERNRLRFALDHSTGEERRIVLGPGSQLGVTRHADGGARAVVRIPEGQFGAGTYVSTSPHLVRAAQEAMTTLHSPGLTTSITATGESRLVTIEQSASVGR